MASGCQVCGRSVQLVSRPYRVGGHYQHFTECDDRKACSARWNAQHGFVQTADGPGFITPRTPNSAQLGGNPLSAA